MAEAGMRPVAYSMSCFLPSRAFEIIKVSICYQNLPVTLVGVGSGISYGEMGATHHAAEEGNIMCTLPNMTVVFPSDATELADALKWAVSHDGPTYISFPKATPPLLPTHPFLPGKAVKYTNGSDGAILAVGIYAETALKVADLLNRQGIHMSVYGLHTTKPLDTAAVIDAARTGNVFVIDEHFAGVGDKIASVILSAGVPLKHFNDFSLPDQFADKVMRYGEMQDEYGLTPEKLAHRIIGVLAQ